MPKPGCALEDLGDAEALVREAGWNQIAADWQIFLDLGTVYAVRTSAGRVIATAATLPYDRFAWISMVLVARDFRRRGLASRLMRRCIDDLVKAGRVPVLDATPDGRQVYRNARLRGHLELSPLHLARTWAVAVAGSDGDRHRDRADRRYGLAAASRLRRGGVRRRSWRTAGAPARTAAREPTCAQSATADSSASCWDATAGLAAQLGPLVADDDAVARALLARAIDTVAGPLYVDLADAIPVFARGSRRVGSPRSGRSPAWSIAARPASTTRARTYAVVGPEFG